MAGVKMKYEAPQPRKFSPAQEAAHRAHEARIDYVAAHREEFLKLCMMADRQGDRQIAVNIVGYAAHTLGMSFDEALYECWRGHYHPNAAHLDFTRSPINFQSYLSVMAAIPATAMEATAESRATGSCAR